MTEQEEIQNYRLGNIEKVLEQVVANQQDMQIRMAQMLTKMEAMVKDHDKVVANNERLDRLEKFVYGAIALAGASFIGLVAEVLWLAVRN